MPTFKVSIAYSSREQKDNIFRAAQHCDQTVSEYLLKAGVEKMERLRKEGLVLNTDPPPFADESEEDIE